jgi:hypothetical protein
VLRRGSCNRSHRRYAGTVHEVVPAKADAYAKEHAENRTKAWVYIASVQLLIRRLA